MVKIHNCSRKNYNTTTPTMVRAFRNLGYRNVLDQNHPDPTCTSLNFVFHKNWGMAVSYFAFVTHVCCIKKPSLRKFAFLYENRCRLPCKIYMNDKQNVFLPIVHPKVLKYCVQRRKQRFFSVPITSELAWFRRSCQTTLMGHVVRFARNTRMNSCGGKSSRMSEPRNPSLKVNAWKCTDTVQCALCAVGLRLIL